MSDTNKGAATSPRHREHPILFSGPMVRAILDGRKTQTRRVVKPQPDVSEGYGGCTRLMFKKRNGEALLNEALNAPSPLLYPLLCPYGDVGDRLWVRETWSMGGNGPFFKATDSDGTVHVAWRPSIHMPRWASRLSLEVTGVRVERVEDITEDDALAEGCFNEKENDGELPSQVYRRLWNSLNAKRGFGWDVNPWVWVISFSQSAVSGSGSHEAGAP